MSGTLAEKIEAIAGEDGWWKSDSEETFLTAAQRLVAMGMTEDEAVDFLDNLYTAVASCYGD